MRICLLFILLLLIQGESQKDEDFIRIISWNILGIGDETSEHLAISRIVKNADIVAFQEVAVGDGPKRLEEFMELLNCGEKNWGLSLSDSTQSSNYRTKERYSFLWNKSRIDTVAQGRLIKDLDSAIQREPYVQKFKFSDKEFDLINIHVCHEQDDCPDNEIIALSNFILESLKGPQIILGDFNKADSSKVFSNLKTKYSPALINLKTTLKNDSCKAGSYLSNAYDNFFFSNEIICITAGVEDYIKTCENFESNDFPSDHLPIYMTFRIE